MKGSHRFFMLMALGGSSCGLVYLRARTAISEPATEHPVEQLVAGAVTPEARELAELQREMARLRVQVWNQGQRLTADPAKVVAYDPATTQVPDPSPAQDPRINPEARAEQERQYHEYMAGVEGAFRNEVRDLQWSSATSSVVRAAITGDDDLRTLARDMECRSHTCRVEIVDDGSGKLDKVLPAFTQQVGQDLPSLAADHVEDAGGGKIIVLYMSRGDNAQATAP